MYTVTLTVHVGDHHASPEPKVVDSEEDVSDIIEQVEDAWAGTGASVRVKQDGHTFAITVED